VNPTEPGMAGGFRPSAWLRWLGAVTFLCASIGFLVEGWTDTTPFRRELTWAVVTLGLTLLGILSARRFRDPAGARLLLGLAAATIPVHFAQVGAQVWSLRVEGTRTIGSVVAGMGLLVILAPPLALGASALVRRRGLLLTGLLFALSCPLLLPTRDGTWIALVALLEILTLAALELTVFRRDARFSSLEGVAARALLLVPGLILLVRNAYYPSVDAWVAALFAVPSIAFLTLPRVSALRGAFARGLEVSGIVGLGIAAAMVCHEPYWLGLMLSLVGLLGAHVALAEPRVFACLGVTALALASATVWITPSASHALLIVPVGTLHALFAYHRRSLPFLIASALVTLAGLVGELVRLVRWPGHDFWLLPAALGVTLLILASALERQRPRLERGWMRLRTHFSDSPKSPNPMFGASE
jgi:hypothetical protein